MGKEEKQLPCLSILCTTCKTHWPQLLQHGVDHCEEVSHTRNESTLGCPIRVDSEVVRNSSWIDFLRTSTSALHHKQ